MKQLLLINLLHHGSFHPSTVWEGHTCTLPIATGLDTVKFRNTAEGSDSCTRLTFIFKFHSTVPRMTGFMSTVFTCFSHQWKGQVTSLSPSVEEVMEGGTVTMLRLMSAISAMWWMETGITAIECHTR